MLITFIVLVGFAFVVLPYVIAPLVVWRTSMQSATAQVEPVGRESIPAEACEFFQHVAASLATQGFTSAAYLRNIDAAGHTVAHLLVMTSESATESAAAIDIRSTSRAGLGQRFVEFSTEFVSGEEINTLNCGVAFITKPDPMKRHFRLPSVVNPAMLYGAHRRLVERHAPASARFIPTRGTEHLHLAHSLEKGYRRPAEFGYYRLDSAAGVYRPTLKGACLMSWKLAWPVKQAREALAKRAAATTLRSLSA